MRNGIPLINAKRRPTQRKRIISKRRQKKRTILGLSIIFLIVISILIGIIFVSISLP